MRHEIVDLRTLIAGFEESYGRLISRADLEADPDNPKPAFIPMLDVLNWTVTIDLRLQQDRGRTEWWSGLTDGALVRGVRFARNRVHHQWANAMATFAATPDRRPLTRLGLRPAETYSQATWRWRRELPAPEDASKKDPRGEELYSQHLAGQLVSETLRLIYALLRTLPEVESGSSRGYG